MGSSLPEQTLVGICVQKRASTFPRMKAPPALVFVVDRIKIGRLTMRRPLGPILSGLFSCSRGRRFASRSCNVYFDEPPGNCVARQSRNVVDGEFIHEPLPVPLDRLDADAKFGGNLLIALPFGDQLKDFELAG